MPKVAEEASNYSWTYRRLCVLSTIDIRNAFNSAFWKTILDALKKSKIDKGLLKIIFSYLLNRKIILHAADQQNSMDVNIGIPQGSILGPALWIVLCDVLFKLDLLKGVSLIGFADDVAILVSARTEEAIMKNANSALNSVSEWMNSNNLQLSPEKTKAVLFTVRRKIGHMEFQMQGTNIVPKRAIRYLGVWLDTKLTFAKQVGRVTEKAAKTVSALSRIMLNIGEPTSFKRRVLANVAHSQMLYA